MKVRYQSISNQVRWGSKPLQSVQGIQQRQEEREEKDEAGGEHLEFLQQHGFARVASPAKCLLLWENILVGHNLDQPCPRSLSLQQVSLWNIFIKFFAALSLHTKSQPYQQH